MRKKKEQELEREVSVTITISETEEFDEDDLDFDEDELDDDFDEDDFEDDFDDDDDEDEDDDEDGISLTLNMDKIDDDSMALKIQELKENASIITVEDCEYYLEDDEDIWKLTPLSQSPGVILTLTITKEDCPTWTEARELIIRALGEDMAALSKVYPSIK